MKKAMLPSIALLFFLSCTTPALADDVYQVDPLPVPGPSPALRAWTHKWHRQAVRHLVKVNRLRHCFGLPSHRFWFRDLDQSDTRTEWYRAGRKWKHRTYAWGAESRRLWRRMTHPGGAGAARWRALIRFYWPAALVDKAVWVVSRESNGVPTARNASGAAGLFQLLPAPAGWSDPAINVRLAYRKYRAAGGWSPWRACGA